MAIVKSVAIGAARKSLGDLTYKHVRGRTVASQRITENSSRTSKQKEQRRSFSMMGKTTKSLRPIIDIGFSRTKYGSPQNNFTTTNKEYMNFLKKDTLLDPGLPSIFNLYLSLIDERFYGNVMSARGSYDTNAEFGWDDDRNIEGYIDLTRNFEAGDTVTIAAAYSYKRRGSYYEMVRMCSIQLGSADIEKLENPNEFIVNTKTISELDSLIKLPEESTELRVIITGIVTGPSGNSTSYYLPAPTRPFHMKATDQLRVEDTIMQVNLADMDDFSSVYDDDIKGAILYLGGLEDPDFMFTVIEFVSNAEDQYCGIKFSTPEGKKLTIPFMGSETGTVQLKFEGELIALIDGLQIPQYVI